MAADSKALQVYDRLIQHGFSPAAAAGIVGNIKAESNFDTTAKGKADKTQSLGIAQWNFGRKQGLFDFAKKQGRKISDLDTQVDYIVHELKQPEFAKAAAALKTARTPAEAAVSFMNHYEKPAEWAKRQSVQQRMRFAQGILDPNRSFEAAIRKGRDFATLDSQGAEYDYSTEDYDTTELQPTEEEVVATTTDQAPTELRLGSDQEDDDEEVVAAKESLVNKQNEKNFLDAYRQQEQQQSQEDNQEQPVIAQQPVQQARAIDPSLYQLPELNIPAYQAPQFDQEFVGEDGGLFDKNKTSWVDSVNKSNMHKNFVQRMYKDGPQIQLKDQKEPSTHMMSYDPQSMRVYPTIVEVAGSLVDLGEGDAAYNYADQTGEYIQFQTPQQAEWYANNGYKSGKNVKVGKASIPFKEDGGYFEDGGELPNVTVKGKRLPVYVTDKNDPRLKAYNDSLLAYNTGKDVAKTTGKLFDGINSTSLSHDYEKYYSKNYEAGNLKYALDGNKSRIYGRKGENLSNKEIKELISEYKDIPSGKKAAEALSKLLFLKVKPSSTLYSAELPPIISYKKPTQPVVYKKPEPTPQFVINWMQGEGYTQDTVPLTEQSQTTGTSKFGEVVDPRTNYKHLTRQGVPMYPLVGQDKKKDGGYFNKVNFKKK